MREESEEMMLFEWLGGWFVVRWMADAQRSEDLAGNAAPKQRNSETAKKQQFSSRLVVAASLSLSLVCVPRSLARSLPTTRASRSLYDVQDQVGDRPTMASSQSHTCTIPETTAAALRKFKVSRAKDYHALIRTLYAPASLPLARTIHHTLRSSKERAP